MKAGNRNYRSPADLPEAIPVFPLSGALLLPRGQMPLNIFEPRYLAMVDAALAGNRIIGMIQPIGEGVVGAPSLQPIGCAGRITSFNETGDGRYAITLTGIARFRTVAELPPEAETPYRSFRITAEPFAADFINAGENDVDRETLLDAFRAYLDAHNLEADWESVDNASNEALVNAIAMISPYGPAEKQALLEAPDLKSRAETLIAITEMELARSEGSGGTLQ